MGTEWLGTCEFSPRPHEEGGHFGAPCRNFTYLDPDDRKRDPLAAFMPLTGIQKVEFDVGTNVARSHYGNESGSHWPTPRRYSL